MGQYLIDFYDWVKQNWEFIAGCAGAFAAAIGLLATFLELPEKWRKFREELRLRKAIARLQRPTQKEIERYGTPEPQRPEPTEEQARAEWERRRKSAYKAVSVIGILGVGLAMYGVVEKGIPPTFSEFQANRRPPDPGPPNPPDPNPQPAPQPAPAPTPASGSQLSASAPAAERIHSYVDHPSFALLIERYMSQFNAGDFSEFCRRHRSSVDDVQCAEQMKSRWPKGLRWTTRESLVTPSSGYFRVTFRAVKKGENGLPSTFAIFSAIEGKEYIRVDVCQRPASGDLECSQM